MGNLSKKVGKRIKEIRELRNLKQYELAEILEMEPSNLTRIESGYQMPKEENITKIADALGVREKDLFDFGECDSKEDLVNKINCIMKKSNLNEIELIYNILLKLKTLK